VARTYRWAAAAVFALTIYGSLLPFHFVQRPLDDAIVAFRHISLADPTNPEGRGDWLLSAALYLTLTCLLTAAASTGRRWWVGFVAAPLAAAVGCMLALVLEFAQLYFPPRTVSLNDILVESAGAVLGPTAWLVFGRRVTRWIRRLEGVTSVDQLAARWLPGFLVVLLIVQLMPFDFVFGQDELASKIADGKLRYFPVFESGSALAVFGRMAVLGVCFFPLGLLVAIISQHSDACTKRHWLVASLVVPGVVKGVQVLIYSRTTFASDVVIGMMGVYAGWWRGRRFPQGLRRLSKLRERGSVLSLSILGASWFGVAAYLYWHPFDFTIEPAQFTADPEDYDLYGFRRLILAPFADYYWGSKYNLLDQLLRKAAIFAPMGALAAVGLRDIYQAKAFAKVGATACVLAVVFESGRFFLPTHSPSTTGVLAACTGACIGYKLTRRARAALWTEDILFGWRHFDRIQVLFPLPSGFDSYQGRQSR
jgi:VanZ family protein